MVKARKPRIEDRVTDVFCRVFGEQHRTTLTPATSMDDVPEWSSLTFMELVFALEEEFGVQFTPDESSQMFQVGHIQRLVKAAVLDVPHDDVAQACCQVHLILQAPKDVLKLIVLSGSSTREGCVRPREAEAMLRERAGGPALWFNLSVSGLVAAETLQLLELLGDDLGKAVVVIGTSPIILAGCGTAEFKRSANHDRFPFPAPVMEAILAKHNYVQDPSVRPAPMTLDLWIQRYLKDRDLASFQYEPYKYPTLAPWAQEKYASRADFLRFYNNAPLNFDESIRINAELFEALADWRDRTKVPMLLADLTMHTQGLEQLRQIGDVPAKYDRWVNEFTARRGLRLAPLCKQAGITDADFRDPAHIFQKREEYTRALIAAAVQEARAAG
jgi:acyl carrier protein